MAERKRVEVAAAVITRPDGSFLLGQRAPGTFYPGYWEFPGGKVEPGEDARTALVRELAEELGIRADVCWPWIVREHDYEHAHVRLNFFEVPEWSGEIRDHVHSALAWQVRGTSSVSPMLPANGPILKALRLPPVMGVTRAAAVGTERQFAELDAALAGGLRLVQVREPGLDPDALRRFAREVVARAREYAALVVVNGDPAVAEACAADGVHLKAAALAGLAARPALEWVGASCHCRAEAERAAALGLDYLVAGTVLPSATHPGEATLGWAGLTALIAGLPVPSYAIGGLGPGDLATARSAGAHGIAMIRGVWRAPAP